MKTKITILDLLYSGWWWVTCIFRAVFVIFVLNNKGGDDGACYLSLVEFIVFPFACFAACSDNAAIFSVGPISSSFLSSPASPASLSNTAVFCGTKDFLFLFFSLKLEVWVCVSKSLWGAQQQVFHMRTLSKYLFTFMLWYWQAFCMSIPTDST